MEMLKKCATNTGNPLFVVPSFNFFGPDVSSCELGMQGDYQKINASLAVALASTWIESKTSQSFRIEKELDYSQLLTPTVRAGLKKAFWPARSHLVQDLLHQAIYYIDGAHTLKSLECCVEWYNKSITSTSTTTRAKDAKRVLIFNIHHERNVVNILEPLLAFDRAVGFDYVFVCPTNAVRPTVAKVPTFSEALKAGGRQDLLSKYSKKQIQALDDVENMENILKWQETIARLWKALRSPTSNGSIEVKNTSTECIDQIQIQSVEKNEIQWKVLVTGSLYLAGEVLEALNWSE
jgi:folylpolyglutamate synthase